MSETNPGEGPDYREEMREGKIVRVCVECGELRYPGDWPFCKPSGHSPGNFGEEPLEPYFDEHICEEGAWITSRGQRRELMRRSGFEYKKKRTDLLPSGNPFMDLGRGR